MLFLVLLFLSSSAVMGTSDWLMPLHWEENDTIYRCEGNYLLFDWMVNLQPNSSLARPGMITFEHKNDEEPANLFSSWFSSFRQDPVAAIHFYPAREADVLISRDLQWAGRVNVTSGLQMQIENLKVSDTGRYTITVKGQDNEGRIRNTSSSINLVVADSMMTYDKELHISQSVIPHYNETSGKHQMVLECGHFMYNTTPPFDVTWILPGFPSPKLGSTGYDVKTGKFFLILESPVETGPYECSLVDKDQLRKACLQYSETKTLWLEDLDSRFWLLEKDLERHRNETSGNMNTLPASHAADVNALQDQVASLEQEVEELMSKVERSQAVLVTGVANTSPAKGDTLKLRNVMFGTGYDNVTGQFEAAYDGTYLATFTMSASTWNGGAGWVGVKLVRDGAVYLFSGAKVDSKTDQDSVTLTAVVELTAGQTLEVQAAESGMRIVGDPEGQMFSVALIKAE